MVYYVPSSTREEQQNSKNRGDKVSSYEHLYRGMKPLEKPIGLITILLVSSDYREKRLGAATKR